MRKILILLLLIFAIGPFNFIYEPGLVYADDDEVEEFKDDIKDAEKELKKELEAKKNLENNLNYVKANLNKTVSEINKTEELLENTEKSIEGKEKDISKLEKKIVLEKEILAKLLREIYYAKSENGLSYAVFKKNLSAAFSGVDHFSQMQNKVVKVMQSMNESKDEITKEKEGLDKEKEKYDNLLDLHEEQKDQLVADKVRTQGAIAHKASTIGELQGEINKLKSSLNKLLGKSYDFDDIIDAAKFAAKKTGIRKDYLLGVLVVESNLGRYTGGCDYKESRMSNYRKDLFKQIANELDYDYKKLKVSCPPSGYSGTGGAMGVAQFMSDTWVGYKSSIAAATGHNPPDPWNLTDGVMAMALKLTKVDGVTKHKRSAEAKAYCVYLAGGNWAAYCDNNGTNYGDKVLYWADNYENLMD